MVPVADGVECRTVSAPEPRRSISPAPRRDGLLLALGAVVVGAHNGLVGAGLGEAGMLALNVWFAAGLVLAARRAGLGAPALGLRISGRGLIAASVIAAAGALVVLAAALTRAVPPDPAVAGLTAAERWFRALVAIPIGTAICEEVMFRGVLLAAAARCGRPRTATIVASALFGLWHVAAESVRTGAFGVPVLPGILATSAASALVLCPLRRRTGDLAAPVALHAVTNLGVFTLVALATPPPA
jgi:membrane protease YdiL (CAAX protease family)